MTATLRPGALRDSQPWGREEIREDKIKCVRQDGGCGLCFGEMVESGLTADFPPN